MIMYALIISTWHNNLGFSDTVLLKKFFEKLSLEWKYLLPFSVKRTIFSALLKKLTIF